MSPSDTGLKTSDDIYDDILADGDQMIAIRILFKFKNCEQHAF